MGVIAERADLTSPSRSNGRAGLRARARFWDRVVTGVLWGVAIAVVALLAYIIIYLLAKGLHVLSWQFITQANVASTLDGPEVFNTFYIILLALLICIPFSMSAAIYLVEYARQGRFTTMVRFATETLAGVPSIILGLFGFLIFVTNFGQGTRMGYSRLAGALTLVILNLPVLLSVFEDALRKVPTELREASSALGANKLQTVTRVLIPTAFPSLITGIILTAGKMIGETAALIYTAGGSSSINGWFSLNPLTSGDTLTIKLYQLQAEGITANAAQVEAGTATLLIILLLVFNLGLRWGARVINRRITGRTR
ncbi:MAG TPA: phosphate ABC transporter permease PstA [Ktedonobacterales bacterium]|nr:phosphate ABC transporter permease PstA [Ktedonobacterales bacterium]